MWIRWHPRVFGNLMSSSALGWYASYPYFWVGRCRNTWRLKGTMLPCILLHATACQLREFTLDLLHAKFISSSIRSFVAQDRQLQCEISCHLRSTKTPLHEIPTDSWVPCIHTSYYQKTSSKWALTTLGLLDWMSLAVNHALWFGKISLV